MRRRAILIGQHEYKDERLRTMSAPLVDVEELADVLGDNAVGGFACEKVLDATEARVRERIAATLKDCSREDVVLLYFSGHGLRAADGQLYLTAVDTKVELLEATATSAAWITERLDKGCLARQQVLVLDCCYSGAHSSGTKAGDVVGTNVQFNSDAQGRVILAASDATQFAWHESRDVGVAERSFFTQGLVHGLRTGQADANKDGVITVEEAFAFAREWVRSKGAKQTPQRWSHRQTDDIHLARSPTFVAPPLPTDVASVLRRVALEQEPLPDERARRRSARGILAGGGLVGGVAVGSFLFHFAQGDARTVSVSFAGVQKCLIGSPIGSDDSIRHRLRGEELAELSAARGGWPRNCGDQVQAYHGALLADGYVEKGQDSLYWSRKLSDDIVAGNVPVAIRDAERLLSVAAADGITPSAALLPEVPSAPPPRYTKGLDDVVPSNIVTACRTCDVTTESHLPDSPYVLFEDRTHDAPPLLCQFTSVTFHCRHPPIPHTAVKLTMIGTRDESAAPLLFAGDQGTEGVFRSTNGAQVERLLVQTAFAGGSGYVALAGFPEPGGRGDFRLIEQAGPDMPARSRLIARDSVDRHARMINRKALLWDRLYLSLYYEGAEENKVKIVPLPFTDFDSAVDMARTKIYNAEFDGCRDGDNVAVVQGDPSFGSLTFRVLGAFTGWKERPDVTGGMACTGSQVWFTSLGAGRLSQAACTAQSCSEVVNVDDKFLRATAESVPRAEAVTVDGNVLVAWATRDRGGIRVRGGPIARISDTSDDVAFDDGFYDRDMTLASTVDRFTLVAARHFAVLLLETVRGTVAVQLLPDGRSTFMNGSTE